MPYSLLRSKVEDYNKMKAEFDALADARGGNGSNGGIIFCNADDPSEILVLLGYDNLDNARQWAQSNASR